MGYHSHFPKAIASAPWWIGGVEMIQFYVAQGTNGLELLLGHLRSNTEFGKLTYIGIEVFCLISGTSWFFFDKLEHPVVYDLKDWFSLL